MSGVHPAVQLKEKGKTPMIDLGTIKMIKKGRIKVFGDIEEISDRRIQFKDGKAEEFDCIILATGYKPMLSKVIDNIEPELGKFNFPKGPIAKAESNKGLYFVGFDNYKLGGILGTIYNDSKIIVDSILKGSK